MEAKAEDEHLAGLRHQFPFEGMAGVGADLSQTLQLSALQQIERRGRERGHITDNGKDHGAQIF